MYSRDYVYVRRYSVDPENNVMVLVSRAVEHPSVPESPEFVRVRSYESQMVIRPHKSFDEVSFTSSKRWCAMALGFLTECLLCELERARVAVGQCFSTLACIRIHWTRSNIVLGYGLIVCIFKKFQVRLMFLVWETYFGDPCCRALHLEGIPGQSCDGPLAPIYLRDRR